MRSSTSRNSRTSFVASSRYLKCSVTAVVPTMSSLAEQQATYYRDPDTGHLMMPGTRRPDGTWRKPRRIKEGYVPQDEVPLYESKGKQWAKARESGPAVPGLSAGLMNMKIDTFDSRSLQPAYHIPGLPADTPAVGAGAENKSKNRKKKKGGSSSNFSSSAATSSAVNQVVLSSSPSSSAYLDPAAASAVAARVVDRIDASANAAAARGAAESAAAGNGGNPVPVATDPAKKLRNLRKKLRDIEALERKLEDGEVTNPEPEQLEKVARKEKVEEEIAELERLVEGKES